MDIDCPEYIQFFPTLRCNKKCDFCFNRGVATGVEVSVPAYTKLVSLISDAGIKEIDILGGEPTLHPDFARLIEIPYKNGLHVFLSSNGSNVQLLQNISEGHSKDLLTIGVSVNGEVISGDLNSYILEHKPLLKGVCTRGKMLPETAIDYLGVQGIEYYMLFMDAVSACTLEESLPFYEFYRKLNDIKKRYGNIKGVFCSCFIPDTATNPVLEYVRCPAGTTKFSVLPDGSVYPCYLFFRHKEFRLGNIFEDDFSIIRTNPVLNFFREFRGNACPNAGCEIFSLCHGGCPAVSLLINGDLRAPDPRCVCV